MKSAPLRLVTFRRPSAEGVADVDPELIQMLRTLARIDHETRRECIPIIKNLARDFVTEIRRIDGGVR